MSEALPGPHHCLSTARIVADIVYRSLHAQCVARGGALSVEDLEHCYSEIVKSFSSGFDLFERRHFQCMSASLSTAEMPFARDRILATILRACGDPAARQAFPQQVEQWGELWLSPFFAGFAEYVRHQCVDADARLIAAYIDAGLYPQGQNIARRTAEAQNRPERTARLRPAVRGTAGSPGDGQAGPRQPQQLRPPAGRRGRSAGRQARRRRRCRISSACWPAGLQHSRRRSPRCMKRSSIPSPTGRRRARP